MRKKNAEKEIKNKKKKKQKLPMKRWEFIFNFVSFLIIIILGIYFGARSLYYYSKQNVTMKKEEATLKAAVLSHNKITTETNGLHQEKDGYVFKGNVEQNYVLFANRLFRIMRINEDNSVKIVSHTNEAILNWGEESSYLKSNAYTWLSTGENENSGIYQKTIPGETALLSQTEWCEGVLMENSVKCDTKQKSYFSLLTLDDYINSAGQKGYLYNHQNSWLIGKNETDDNLYISSDGSVEEATTYQGYGVRVVMTLKANIKITGGSGTATDPYIINQEEYTNNIGKYVKLGNDVYRVYEERGNLLRLSLNDYLKVGEEYLEREFSRQTALYSSLNRYNISYYLNHNFYNSLSYQALLSDCSLPVGEVAVGEGGNYLNQYSDLALEKVGLLSLYDWNNNTNLTDFYLINTTGSSMAWIYNKDGVLEEDKVTEPRKVIPTVCVDKNLIKAGEGNLENPYVME